MQFPLGGTVLLLLVPQIHKEFGCCGAVPGVVIVSECKNLQYFGISHQRFENLYPILQIVSTVADGLVPGRRLLLNPLAVSKPANVSEVRCNQIDFFLHLPRSRHKRCVGQCQSNVVLSEHVRESSIEPGLVSNLDDKFVIGRKLLEEGFQHGEKMILLREFPAVEERKLKDHRTKFWTENIHRVHELLEFGITVH